MTRSLSVWSLRTFVPAQTSDMNHKSSDFYSPLIKHKIIIVLFLNIVHGQSREGEVNFSCSETSDDAVLDWKQSYCTFLALLLFKFAAVVALLSRSSLRGFWPRVAGFKVKALNSVTLACVWWHCGAERCRLVPVSPTQQIASYLPRSCLWFLSVFFSSSHF